MPPLDMNKLVLTLAVVVSAVGTLDAAVGGSMDLVSNSDCSTAGGAGFPIAHAAALDRRATSRAVPTQNAPSPGPASSACCTSTTTARRWWSSSRVATGPERALVHHRLVAG